MDPRLRTLRVLSDPDRASCEQLADLSGFALFDCALDVRDDCLRSAYATDAKLTAVKITARTVAIALRNMKKPPEHCRPSWSEYPVSLLIDQNVTDAHRKESAWKFCCSSTQSVTGRLP